MLCYSKLLLLIVSVICALVVNASSSYPACATGMTCLQVTTGYGRDSLIFDCASVKASSNVALKGNVYFMHGNDGRYAKAMFAEVMSAVAEKGFNTLACDQRGYSPGAAPDDYQSYNYDNLQQDIFNIVDSEGSGFGFDVNSDGAFHNKFHVVAHDQGARVAWHAIAKGGGRSRFLSFSTLSIPHTDAFSNGLYGATGTCFVVLCRALSCSVVLCRALSCLILSYQTTLSGVTDVLTPTRLTYHTSRYTT